MSIVQASSVRIEQIGESEANTVSLSYPQIRQYQQDPSNISLRNSLIEQYLPIVEYIAKNLANRIPSSSSALEASDLVNDGIFGLMKALERFEPDRGVKFETYCVQRIRGAMLDSIRGMDWVPRLVRHKASILNNAISELDKELGRAPTDPEIIEHLGLKNIDELDSFRDSSRATGVQSLSSTIYSTDQFKDVAFGDTLSDPSSPDPQRQHLKKEWLGRMTQGMTKLQRLIYICYYHCGDTMLEIGKRLEISESRVSQMHSEMVEWIRNRFASEFGGNDRRLTLEQILGRVEAVCLNQEVMQMGQHSISFDPYVETTMEVTGSFQPELRSFASSTSSLPNIHPSSKGDKIEAGDTLPLERQSQDSSLSFDF